MDTRNSIIKDGKRLTEWTDEDREQMAEIRRWKAEAEEAARAEDVHCKGCGREFYWTIAGTFITEDNEWVCRYCFHDSTQGWELDPRWHTDSEYYSIVYQPHAQPNAETLTEAEAAKLIGVSKVTLQRARKRGEVSYYRVGARVLYSMKHINDFLSGVERRGQVLGGGE